MTEPLDTLPASRAIERVARESYGKLVAIVAAQDRDLAAAEDALSDALAAALRVWPLQGVPTNPEGWLVTAARNVRRNAARGSALRNRAEPEILRRIDEAQDRPNPSPLADDRLRLMFVCSHPAIDPSVRTPLILHTVLGIDAARIARAFLVEPSTMAQRLVRAKARIRDAGLRFEIPDAKDVPERLGAVLDAVYAAFGDAWDNLQVGDGQEPLSGEAIWLARLLVALMPDEPEPKGLLALMLYCSARSRARRDPEGRFVPLDRQDARLWDRTRIIEAEELLTLAARSGRFGRYQCEAAIQSVHIQRPITGRLNLDALKTLYDLLVSHSDSIGARIGRAVVTAEAGHPLAALTDLEALPAARVKDHQPYWVALSRVARLAGRQTIADDALARAIALTRDDAVRAFLMRDGSEPGPDRATSPA